MCSPILGTCSGLLMMNLEQQPGPFQLFCGRRALPRVLPALNIYLTLLGLERAGGQFFPSSSDQVCSFVTVVVLSAFLTAVLGSSFSITDCDEKSTQCCTTQDQGSAWIAFLICSKCFLPFSHHFSFDLFWHISGKSPVACLHN